MQLRHLYYIVAIFFLIMGLIAKTYEAKVNSLNEPAHYVIEE